MNTEKNLGFATRQIHAGKIANAAGALCAPIYQTSTFTFTSADHAMGVFSGQIPGYDYTRAGNPTVRVFEEKIAQLEGGEDAVATASGMGAVGSVMIAFLKTGDHVTLDLEAGTAAVLESGKILSCDRLGEQAQKILSAGGIKPLMRRRQAESL